MTNPKIGMLAGLLDRSGSMMSLKDKVIESMNALLHEQARLVKHGEMEDIWCYLAQFDTHWDIPIQEEQDGYEVLVDMDTLDWAELPDVSDYQPRGMTALYDAITRFIDDVGNRLSKIEESQRPGTVIIFINTDGMDNDSVRHTAASVREKIKHQEEKYNWKFIFATSDIAAAEEARKAFGIKDVQAYKSSNTREGFSTLSKTLSVAYKAGAGA